MKKEIHPKNYRLVAFKDMSNEHVFITKSTVNTKETLTIDGVGIRCLRLKFQHIASILYR